MAAAGQDTECANRDVSLRPAHNAPEMNGWAILGYPLDWVSFIHNLVHKPGHPLPDTG
jgi:hypothetical protein